MRCSSVVLFVSGVWSGGRNAFYFILYFEVL